MPAVTWDKYDKMMTCLALKRLSMCTGPRITSEEAKPFIKKKK